mmetsp:Transcript_115468/g.337736  ORF Transcript_115468/g.337736 Transcript_115468/m.337736 type:complete len:238 (+) Transcript_115468:637-1350(+)
MSRRWMILNLPGITTGAGLLISSESSTSRASSTVPAWSPSLPSATAACAASPSARPSGRGACSAASSLGHSTASSIAPSSTTGSTPTPWSSFLRMRRGQGGAQPARTVEEPSATSGGLATGLVSCNCASVSSASWASGLSCSSAAAHALAAASGTGRLCSSGSASGLRSESAAPAALAPAATAASWLLSAGTACPASLGHSGILSKSSQIADKVCGGIREPLVLSNVMVAFCFSPDF